MRCPSCRIGKLVWTGPEYGYYGGPLIYRCTFAPGGITPSGPGCGWEGQKPQGLIRRAARRLLRGT